MLQVYAVGMVREWWSGWWWWWWGLFRLPGDQGWHHTRADSSPLLPHTHLKPQQGASDFPA